MVYTFQRDCQSFLDLIVRTDHPVYIAGPRYPVSPCVFRFLERGRTPAQDQRLLTQQRAYTARVWIFAAGSVMAPSHLDGLPSRPAAQQLAQQGCLAYFG